MNRTWLRRIAVFGLVAALVPTAARAQNRDSDTLPLRLSTGIAVEAARLASGEARQSGKFESTSQSSSGPNQNARTSRRATYGVAFGFVGLLVGAAIGEKLPGPGPTTTQLMSVAIGGGSGVAIGLWLGGR